MPLEEDLYAPVKNHFLSQGYTVRGEVLGIDLVAVKDDKHCHCRA